MVKGSVGEEEAFDPTTTTTTTSQRLSMLHLGSSNTTTTCSTISDDNQVLFADPCTMCGTKKRRISPLQPISFKPRKKTTIRSFSFPPSYHSLPQSKKPFDSFLAFPSPTLTTQTVPSPPTPEAEPQVPFLAHFNSFSSSSGTPPRSAERPPRPPVLFQSVSDLSPKTAPPVLCRSVSTPTRKTDEETDVLTMSGGGESPNASRWKRMREGLAEMKNWVDDLIQEPQTDDQQTTSPPKTCGSEEENVGLEGNGAAYRMVHKCGCGKSYQIVLSILPV